MKPIEVNQDFVDSLVQSNGWERAGISVLREETSVEEEDRLDEKRSSKDKKEGARTGGDAKAYGRKKGDKSETHAGVDEGTQEEEDMEALELLEAILEELSDDELLEHASQMLQVFDAAAEELELLSEMEDEESEGEVVEEEYEEDIDEMSPALMRAILKSQRQES